MTSENLDTEKIPFNASLVMRVIPELGSGLSETPFLNQDGRKVLTLYPELTGWDVQAAAEAYMYTAILLKKDEREIRRHDDLIPKLREVLAAGRIPITTETKAIEAGMSREVIGRSFDQELNLLIAPDTDLDSKFMAFDLDMQEVISVCGWLGVFEDI